MVVWRAQIQELEEAGRGPGRWATADGFFNFDSSQIQRAMGLLQLKRVLVFLSGGSGRRRGGRPEEVCGRSMGINVNFVLFRFFSRSSIGVVVPLSFSYVPVSVFPAIYFSKLEIQTRII